MKFFQYKKFWFLKWHDFHHFFSFSHWNLQTFVKEFLTNHMYNEIYWVAYEYFWTKNIRDIYRTYSLIIILIVGNLTSVRYEILKILKMSHIIMRLPYVQLELNWIVLNSSMLYIWIWILEFDWKKMGCKLVEKVLKIY